MGKVFRTRTRPRGSAAWRPRRRILTAAVTALTVLASCGGPPPSSQVARSLGPLTATASSGAVTASAADDDAPHDIGQQSVARATPPTDVAPPQPLRHAQGGRTDAGDRASASDADESPYAPVARPGPALRVSRDALDASLRCPAALDAVDQPVVLLIPGTTVTPQEAFEWNYARAFAAEGIPYCMVTVPEHTNGDIQVAAEYVVDAVRTIHAATDHRVILLGWSQGASTLPRWAIRFWPDIRPMISDLIGLAPLNNAGSLVADALCLPGACIPAGWQQRNGSAFIDALNSRQQVFDDIDYTVIYSRVDTVVTPNLDGGLSVLPEGPNVTNVAISDVCPTDLSEHLLIVASPVAWAYALDAIRHPGEPADPARVAVPALCAPGLMPHVSPIDLLLQEARIAANVGPRVMEGQVSAEPPLAEYVFAD